jgi:hypothetical protein
MSVVCREGRWPGGAEKAGFEGILYFDLAAPHEATTLFRRG